MSHRFLSAALIGLLACGKPSGTEPPADGWANTGPTVVEQVIDRGVSQLLSVRQGVLSRPFCPKLVPQDCPGFR